MAIISIANGVLFGGGGGGSVDPADKPQNVGTLTSSSVNFPTTRTDGTDLKNNDYCIATSDESEVFPFYVSYEKDGLRIQVKVDYKGQKFNYENGDWVLDDATYSETAEVIVTNKGRESISGQSHLQSQINEEVKDFVVNLPQSTITFTNKTINAENNTISNITPLHNVKSGYYNRHVTDLTKYYCWKNENVFTTTEQTGDVIGYNITITDCMITGFIAITDKNFQIKLNDNNEKILQSTDKEDASIIKIYNRDKLEDKLFGQNLDTKLPSTELVTEIGNFAEQKIKDAISSFEPTDDIADKVMTFTNKTIDADSNTISNIKRSNFKENLITDNPDNHPYLHVWECDDEEEVAHFFIVTKTIDISDEPQPTYDISFDNDYIENISISAYYGVISEISYHQLRLSIDIDGVIKTYHRKQDYDQYFLYKEITSANFVLNALKNISVSSDSIIDVQTLPVTDIDDKKIYRTKENTPIQMEKLWIYNTISNLFSSISRIIISQENYNLLTEQQKNDGTAYILPNGQSVVTFSYDNLPDKPRINNVTLQDNMSSEDLNMYTRQEVDYLVSQTVSSTLKTYIISDLFSTDNTVISVSEFTSNNHKCYILNNVLYVDIYFNSTNSISNSNFKRLMTFHGGNEYEAMYDAQIASEVTRGQASMYNSGEYISTELSVQKTSINECEVSIFYTRSMLNKTDGLNVHLKMFVKKR